VFKQGGNVYSEYLARYEIKGDPEHKKCKWWQMIIDEINEMP
jgi:hypothetical protein